MVGLYTHYNPPFVGKNKLVREAPNKGSTPTPIPAVLQAFISLFALTLGSLDIYINVGLQKYTGLAIKLFIQGPEHGWF